MKKISILAAVCCLFAGAAFASDTGKSTQIELHASSLVGPTGIPVAYMYENTPQIQNTKVTFETFASPAALLPKMIKGEVDIGFLPANAAAKAFTATKGAVIAAGISGTGTITLITKDASVKTFTDLKGKKVAVAGQGATPEYMFRYLLAANNVKEGTGADAVELDFSIETSKLAAELLSGRVQYAVVPEPFATVASIKDASVIRAIDFQVEYAKINGKDTVYPLTLIVVRKSFAAEHPDTVRAFLDAYKKSTDWTIANPQKSGALVQKYTLGLAAPVVAKAVPACNFVCIDAQTGRAAIEKLLNIFLQFAPESVGGSLPADSFYFK